MAEWLSDQEFLSGLIFSSAAVAFLVLIAVLVIGRKAAGPGNPLIVACIVTALWAGLTAIGFWGVEAGTYYSGAGETARTIAWQWFLISLLYRTPREHRSFHKTISVIFGASVLVGLVLIAFEFMIPVGQFDRGGSGDMAQGYFIGHLVLTVAALTLLENLYRNASVGDRWSIRLLAIGLFGLLGFDLFLYADALLYQKIDDNIFIARGLVAVVVAPMLALAAARNPNWKLDVFISRQIVFHAVSVLASGVYLLAIAAGGYYLREFGGNWGGILQIAFFATAILFLILLLTSGWFRARARIFVTKHFFNYKFDYRDEWLRFITTVSSSRFAGDLKLRVIQAVCDITDSPGGILCMREPTGDLVSTVKWNFPDEPSIRIRSDDKLLEFLNSRNWVVDLHDLAAGSSEYTGVKLPDWANKDRRLWLIVPLIHHDELLGIILQHEARARRSLNWEDHDLLKTVGKQAASYLAEQQAQAELLQARQFQAFSERFAFVMHDVKNVVSQLSLLLKNAEKYAGDPEFQKDMVATVQQSVEKMKLLLGRLSEQGERGQIDAKDVELNEFLSKILAEFDYASGQIDFDSREPIVWVTVEQDNMAKVFCHIIQNGLDATDDQTGRVHIRLGIADQGAQIEIEDNGCGMDEDFVRNELFKPFRSTKEQGYGIGAFESRQTILAHGGRLDVSSTVGEKTVFTIWLPLAQRIMAQSRAELVKDSE